MFIFGLSLTFYINKSFFLGSNQTENMSWDLVFVWLMLSLIAKQTKSHPFLCGFSHFSMIQSILNFNIEFVLSVDSLIDSLLQVFLKFIQLINRIEFWWRLRVFPLLSVRKLYLCLRCYQIINRNDSDGRLGAQVLSRRVHML